MPTILQISAGQGPAECRAFVPLLAEIIRKEAAEQNIVGLPPSNGFAQNWTFGAF